MNKIKNESDIANMANFLGSLLQTNCPPTTFEGTVIICSETQQHYYVIEESLFKPIKYSVVRYTRMIGGDWTSHAEVAVFDTYKNADDCRRKIAENADGMWYEGHIKNM